MRSPNHSTRRPQQWINLTRQPDVYYPGQADSPTTVSDNPAKCVVPQLPNGLDLSALDMRLQSGPALLQYPVINILSTKGRQTLEKETSCLLLSYTDVHPLSDGESFPTADTNGLRPINVTKIEARCITSCGS